MKLLKNMFNKNVTSWRFLFDYFVGNRGSSKNYLYIVIKYLFYPFVSTRVDIVRYSITNIDSNNLFNY